MLLLHLAAIMALMPVGTSTAANAITLAASEPAVIYYTTNGAAPAAPVTDSSVTPSVIAAETISLVPDAGRGTNYVKPQKLKFHESKHEFEKHVKQKHGKRFRVETFKVKQTEHGLEGFIDIIENKDTTILQLGDTCTEEERAKRIAIAREFILNNPEMSGLTDNEELRERGLERNYCSHLYFDRYINGFEAPGVFHLIFQPRYNYSIYAVLDPITPEMFAAAQQKVLSEEEIAAIVNNDMNVVVSDKTDKVSQKLPKFKMHKYLRNKEPYAIWEVRGRYIYEINAITGEIVFKQLNIKY